ncbi:HAMP domain-containing sensor histidine kinase [uncultured Microscilla sp.]|uniref:sensor histidine kinase n=1 Tax=uncultured Microscilla sp. TaxID=432653 RepID=UPI0026226309|nr:HAMP domain-containing sensor histidine kinase [uncultured Microscilla sp.]
MYNKLKVGLCLCVMFWSGVVMGQSGSKLTSQPAGEVRTLMAAADAFMKSGAYSNAYNTYLKLVNVYKQKNNQAGVVANVDKIIALHEQKKINLPSNTLINYYTTRRRAANALGLKTPPKMYLNMAEVYAKAKQMKKAIYFAEKGLRLSDNTETADLLNTFLRNLDADKVNYNGNPGLKAKLRAVQQDLIRKEHALQRLKRQSVLLRKQILGQAEDLEKMDRNLKSQTAIAKNRHRVNEQLEESNNKRKWWNIVLIFLALVGFIVGGYSAAKLYFNGRQRKQINSKLVNKEAALLTAKDKLLDAKDTIQSQKEELQDKKYTIQRHLSEIDGRKIELVELTEQAQLQKRQLAYMKESKVQLAETIAQDLKKPLDVILRSKDLVAIQGAGDQMKKYTEEMLAIQQYLNGHLDLKIADFNFHYVVQQTIAPWLAQAEKKGVIVVNQVPAQYWGTFDKGLISRVVEKLFRKAIQHTLTGGKVAISGKPIHPTETNDHSIGELELSIADDGASILYDEFQKIFQPLMDLNAREFSDKALAGIDLTFCKVALEAHQSNIKVASATGVGTTFTFQLPLGSPQQMID